jgi:hypothetical protein
MASCSETEKVALQEAGPLLRFAAEHVKNLDPEYSRVIAEAQAAAERNEWTPEIAQRFWSAFSKLCELIQPVTMDCLAASQRTEPGGWVRFGHSGKRSVAERSSKRYLVALLVLLAIILPIQLYVWICTNLSKKIDDFIAADKARLVQLFEDHVRLDAAIRDKEPDKWSADERTRAEKISADAASLHEDATRIFIEARILARLSTLFTDRTDFTSSYAVSPKWHENYRIVVDRFNSIPVRIFKIQERANLVVGVLASFLLPVLFGTAGAVAYVIQAISDQIRTTTFGTNSPIRHVMRVALGALAGVVVGLFNGLSVQELSLSPLAIAFLAGYGVEAVFSMFDALVDKFRQPRQEIPARTDVSSG